MPLQPLDVVALIKSIVWPVVATTAVVIFRKTLTDIVRLLAERLNKVSIGGLSLELAVLSELRPRALDSELRELAAAPPPPSIPGALLAELTSGGDHDFILIDLGSHAARRWLTSRLYLFSVMLARVSRLKCFVFVETAAEIRNRFVGIATPDAVRWALARRYPWLEPAYAWEYAHIDHPQFDTVTGPLSIHQTNQIVSRFLNQIRVPNVEGGQLLFDPARPPNVVDLGDGLSEYASWLDGGMIEAYLGADLSTASVQIPPGKTLDDVGDAVRRERGRSVAVVETDRTFRRVLDRLRSPST